MSEVLGKHVFITQKQRDLLINVDPFTSTLFTWGILFDCDFWGILPNNPRDIKRCLNPDATYEKGKIEKALEDLEHLGLITFFGDDNFLIYVEDWGEQNYIPYLRINFTKHNNKPKYEVEMKEGIKQGQLPPYILDIPTISKRGGNKKDFINQYSSKTLSDEFKTKLLYPMEYEKWRLSNTDKDIDTGLNNSNQDNKTKSTSVSVSTLTSNKEVYVKDIKSKEQEGLNEKDLPF